MRIGTDLSLKECRAEGYLMMDFLVRELRPNKVFNPDSGTRFFAHLPDYIREEMGWVVGDKSIYTDTYYSANDLWETYTRNKEGIDSMIGGSHGMPTCEYGMLSLASDISAYCGLD